MLALMVTQLDLNETWQGVSRAGYWFAAVLVLWALLYIMNTAAIWIIIHSQQSGAPAPQDNGTPAPKDSGAPVQQPLSFLWLYKITVSGFALNYATPGGLLGGEPYKIMSLAPKIGTERATAAVILHTMTHIFSHFWFWLLSCLLFVMVRTVNFYTATILLSTTVFCLAGIWFFLKGYKGGIAVQLLRVLRHITGVRNWATRFIHQHEEQLHAIDQQISALHNQNPRTFASAVMLELVCRIISALEIFFILLVVLPSANYADCILILAFTSLFANMLFFIPLQLGGREGGFMMSIIGLGMTASEGIFVALLVRLRELIWTGIGLLLIKFERKSK